MKYHFDRPRSDRISDDLIVAELKRVAEHYGYRRYTRHDFDAISTTCKGSVVLQRFRTWEAALDATGIVFTPYRKNRKDRIPPEDLLSELARIWECLGHRPSKTEWDNSDAKFSYTTYKSRFGGWINACKMLVDNEATVDTTSDIDPTIHTEQAPQSIPKERSRNVPLKVRLAVLKRDKYRCVLCGRSPATHPTVSLHLDHITAYADGGETTKDNLRTLCEDCNWGKGKDAEVG